MKSFEKEKITVRFGEHTLCEGPAEMMCGWRCRHCGAWQITAPVTQDKLQKRLEFTLKPRGHWTKEPLTKPGWYKIQYRSCLTGEIEFSFEIAGPDCEWWNFPNEVLWRWSEPEELPEPPEDI